MSALKNKLQHPRVSENPACKMERIMEEFEAFAKETDSKFLQLAAYKKLEDKRVKEEAKRIQEEARKADEINRKNIAEQIRISEKQAKEQAKIDAAFEKENRALEQKIKKQLNDVTIDFEYDFAKLRKERPDRFSGLSDDDIKEKISDFVKNQFINSLMSGAGERPAVYNEMLKERYSAVSGSRSSASITESLGWNLLICGCCHLPRAFPKCLCKGR